eukprot:TRINITY_DN12072_c0_g3_i2.p1 TRINITY_DN12072_c0_g3~~TRINITY_DN12072_c0_g3_i2.p1  ORF type:complete len:256 (+),score=83.34 TRINITY_DN12072_c0_g3_i2:17-784(+)
MKSEAEIKKLKVNELKQLLQAAGLSTDGLKADLVKRLSEYYAEEQSLLAEAEDDNEAATVDDTLAEETVETETATKSAEPSTENSEAKEAPALTTAAATTAAATASTDKPKDATSTEARLARAQRFGISTATSKDQKEARAKRFGITKADKKAESDKKATRAERFGTGNGSNNNNQGGKRQQKKKSGPNLAKLSVEDIEKLKRRAEKFGDQETLDKIAAQAAVIERKKRFGDSGASAGGDDDPKKQKRAERFGAA